MRYSLTFTRYRAVLTSISSSSVLFGLALAALAANLGEFAIVGLRSLALDLLLETLDGAFNDLW